MARALQRIKHLDAVQLCGFFSFLFLGRVHGHRKEVQYDPRSGILATSYQGTVPITESWHGVTPGQGGHCRVLDEVPQTHVTDGPSWREQVTMECQGGRELHTSVRRMGGRDSLSLAPGLARAHRAKIEERQRGRWVGDYGRAPPLITSGSL